MYRRVAATVVIISCIASNSARSDVVWSDEFNGDAIDRSVWTWDVGGHGFGNGQMEYDTARTENSYIENGSLVIEARREDYRGKSFTSARMLTQGRFAFEYGQLEARIKVPDTANGLWPAFWMLGNNSPGIGWPMCGEADILEMGSKAGIDKGLQRRKINCALHFAGANGRKGMHDAWLDAPVDLNLDYHLYKISWTPEYMKFYLDGVEFASWDITADHLREFHQPFFIILNIAVGGWNSSYTGVSTPRAVTASLPAKMYVDWIRLSSNEHTKLYLAKDTEETGDFGIFTETKPVKTSLRYEDGSDPDFNYAAAAALYTWNNMAEAASTNPSEGSKCWSFDIAAGNWFGAGVFLPNFRNMSNYSDGRLHFDIKTISKTPMSVGIKSSRRGESWLPLGDESAELGFPRDGKWHKVAVPLRKFESIDFHTVHQMFMLKGDPPSSAFNLSIDNIWWQPK
ncbi:MAG: glycoside hydrolase family 16 protein [Sedimentisphaerales bacterium]|nr:glycoside hydrolase family 16 protein [Sedimentisphaerales bacterium]